MSKPIAINGHDIQPGEYKQIILDIARLPSRTEIDTIVEVFRSKKDGPVLLLMAGLHGDELNGVETIRRLINDKLINPLRGTVIAIPILNVFGFINFSRDVPDGKDVNRSFPGHEHGSLASRVAFHFMRDIFPHIDYGVDFHTGGASRSNFPQLRCVLSNKKNEELARAFAPPFILHSKLRDRSLRKSAELAGKSIIVFEAGESLRFDELAINEGMNGVLRLMYHLKMTDTHKPAISETITLVNSTWVRARHAGLFRYFIPNGSKVEKNQVIASISGPYGEFDKKIKSPKTGYVIGVNNMPIVNQGDALFHIGLEN